MSRRNLQALGHVDNLPPVEPVTPVDLVSLRFDILDAPADVEAEWRALSRLPRNSLNQDFDWACAWWRAVRRTPLILRARAGDRTVMLLPLELVSEYGLTIARFPGGRFNNLNTGLFSADFPEPDDEETRRLAAALAGALAPKADLVLLDTLHPSPAGIRHPFHALMTLEHPDRSFQLPLKATMDETIAQLNAKTRRKRHRQQCRRLDALGGFEHSCPEGASEQHALLDLFFDQKSERLAAAGLPDVFQPPEVRGFLHGLIDRSVGKSDHPLRLHALRLRDERRSIVAISGMSRKGDHVLCQFGSIDDKLCPDASPGELLFWLMIEQACLEGAAVFDFGLGDQPYKRSWCTQETVLYDILLPLSWKGRLAQPLLAAVRGLKKAVKRSDALYSTVQRLRSLAAR